MHIAGTYILPPRSFVFIVTAIDPTQTMMNTSANSGPPSWLFRSSEYLIWRSL